jgi:acylphosphatase
MIRREVRYQGRVQGVGFRATCRDIAHNFVVAGWLRNEPDGSVYLVAEGESGEVLGFLREIQAQLARNIRAADVREVPPQGERVFEIRR